VRRPAARASDDRVPHWPDDSRTHHRRLAVLGQPPPRWIQVNDLDLAHRRRQERVIQEAADDRDVWQQYREAFDHQQATNPGFPEAIELGGPFSVQAGPPDS
jgi:hypothetical protein